MIFGDEFEKGLVIVHSNVTNQVFVNVDTLLFWIAITQVYIMVEQFGYTVHLNPAQLLSFLFCYERQPVLKHHFVICHLFIV